MGFGLLLIGYLITYVVAINPYGVAFRLLGYAIMAYAAFKLSAYEKKFRYGGYAAALLSGMSVLGVAELIVNYLYDNMVISINPFSSTYSSVMLYVEAVCVFGFQLVLLLAIRKIAKDTDVNKIELNAGRNIFFISLYYVLNILGELPLPIKDSYAKYMSLPLLLFYIVWIAFQIGVLFSCYANICDENDVDMERKPSRFAFVNKFRAELDAKQERARRDAENRRREKRNSTKKENRR